MTTKKLDAIVELQQALSELAEKEALLAGIPDWMRELHAEHSGRRAEIEEIEQASEDAAHDRRLAEAAVDDAQTQLKRFQEQISQVRTQREYGALLQEIDTVKEQIKGSEDEAFAAMEKQEEARGELEEKREAFRELDERYAAELERWEEEKPEVAAEAERLRKRIAALREEIPQSLLTQFDRIRERHGGDALAPVRVVARAGGGGGMRHCGVCNYRVRPQVANEIGSGAMVQCDSCKRILYFEEAPG